MSRAVIPLCLSARGFRWQPAPKVTIVVVFVSFIVMSRLPRRRDEQGGEGDNLIRHQEGCYGDDTRARLAKQPLPSLRRPIGLSLLLEHARRIAASWCPTYSFASSSINSSHPSVKWPLHSFLFTFSTKVHPALVYFFRYTIQWKQFAKKIPRSLLGWRFVLELWSSESLIESKLDAEIEICLVPTFKLAPYLND